MRARDRSSQAGRTRRGRRYRRSAPVIAALDLGTNNCRLLIARVHPGGFHVIDGFSRIVRLGEGMQFSGGLSGAAEGLYLWPGARPLSELSECLRPACAARK